jgi:hypothetical protein
MLGFADEAGSTQPTQAVAVIQAKAGLRRQDAEANSDEVAGPKGALQEQRNPFRLGGGKQEQDGFPLSRE